MRKYLIIGNGIAGTTAAEYIRKYDAKGIITLVGEEDIPLYSRIRLNEYIAGDTNESDLIIRQNKWHTEKNIKFMPDTIITGAEPHKKIVVTQKGEELFYDRLLIATGSHSFIPPIKGADQSNVFALRNIQDARNIKNFAKHAENVVIIGGGLLGLESGSALLKSGKKVTVVEFFSRLLPRQLDQDGAEKLQSMMENMRFAFRLDAQTSAITEQGNVVLKDKETLAADMVIISAGVRPNLDIARLVGADTEKGIKVDSRMQTNRPNIFAAGDVVQFQGLLYGIWPAAMEQGKTAGTNMAGKDMRYAGTVMANTLKIAGIDLASAGNIDVENKLEHKIVTDKGVYKKLVFEGDRIVGCIMLGDKKGFKKIVKDILN
jgi:nitrite reductase (NADH) large subunit